MELSLLSIQRHSNSLTQFAEEKALYQVNFPQIGPIFQFATKCDKS